MQRIAAGILAVTCVAGLLAGCSSSPMEGKYVLVERTLPDGSVLAPPMVNGFMSYEDNVRTMNMNWSDADGQHSVAYVGVFDFSEYEYAERNVSFVANDPNAGLIQNFEDFSGTSELVYTKGGVRFNFPIHHGNTVVTVTDNGFIATQEGRFVDRWERVEVVTPEAEAAATGAAFAGFLKPIEIPGAEFDGSADETTVTVEATEDENPSDGG